MNILLTALFVGSACLASCGAAADGQASDNSAAAIAVIPSAVIEELLAADRAFSEASEKTDSVTGISAMFADDVAMYAVPVPGFATSKSEAADHIRQAIGDGAATSKSKWTPIRGGISADGKHGFTFGFMTTEEAGKPAWIGKYVSYWVKKPEGWRVTVYKRSPREPGEVSLALREPLLPPTITTHAPDTAEIDKARESMAATEKAFSDDSQTIGLRAAFIKYGRSDSVNGNFGSGFVTGNQAIGEAHPDGPSPLYWKADHSLVAGSGDLGVNWGLLHRNSPPRPGQIAQIPYFTIWYRASEADPWLYVVE